MKNVTIRIISIGSAVALTAGLLAGCGSASVVATPTAEADASQQLVSVTGVVVPERWVALAPVTGGTVTEVAVAEGDSVLAGQVLLRLEAGRQQAAVAQAEAALAGAEARLQQLQAGARSEEIERAQVAVSAAEAGLVRLQEGATPTEIAVAEAAVSAAQAALQQVREGPSDFELIGAQADLANAEAQLHQAQAAYDQVSASADIGARPESAALQQATNAYQAAKAAYDELQQGPTAGAVAVAQAGVRQAMAELERVKAPARASDVAAAEAQVQAARLELELLQAGATGEQIAAAEADVAAAQATLQLAQAALAETEVRAPIDGTATGVHTKVGELVAAGTPVLEVAALGGLRVETTDLNEIDVVQLQPGQQATVTFDALPGVAVPASISRIASRSSEGAGVNYTVVIELSDAPEQLRWGMTAFVDFAVR